MKMKPEKYAVMLAACRAVVDHVGGPDKVKQQYATATVTRMLWGLWHVAWFDLQYDDNHPAYQAGRPRMVPQNTNFKLYSDGDNDSHIETALKAIGRELGLIK